MLIKSLEIINAIVFKYSIAFFFIIDLYVLIPESIAQIFIPTVEFVIPTGTQANKANADIETQPVTVEAKKSSIQHNLNAL